MNKSTESLEIGLHRFLHIGKEDGRVRGDDGADMGIIIAEVFEEMPDRVGPLGRGEGGKGLGGSGCFLWGEPTRFYQVVCYEIGFGRRVSSCRGQR